MNTKLSLRAVVLFALLIASGFIGVQYFRTQLSADDEMRANPFAQRDAALAAERNKPRFNGEIGGIFIAPQGTPVPEKYTSFESVCGPDPVSVVVPEDQAGAFALTIDLPEEYVFQPDDMDTGTYTCENGVVVLSKKAYTYNRSGFVIIGRTVIGYDELDVSKDRPKLMNVAGRSVVVIEPLTENSFLENGYAWIPEPFGDTFISTHNVPRNEFMKLVQLVASSTRTQ